MSGSTGYSLFVKIAKLVLLVGAVVMIGVVISRLSSHGPQTQIADMPVEDMTAPGETEITSALYEGSDEKGQNYTLAAERARKVSEDSTEVLLEKPEGHITLLDGGKIFVAAKNGIYDMQGMKLALDQDVVLRHDTGYTLYLEHLDADLGTRAARSTQPVHGGGPLGDIKATGMTVEQGGQRIVFSGPAVLILKLSAQDEKIIPAVEGKKG